MRKAPSAGGMGRSWIAGASPNLRTANARMSRSLQHHAAVEIEALNATVPSRVGFVVLDLSNHGKQAVIIAESGELALFPRVIRNSLRIPFPKACIPLKQELYSHLLQNTEKQMLIGELRCRLGILCDGPRTLFQLLSPWHPHRPSPERRRTSNFGRERSHWWSGQTSPAWPVLLPHTSKRSSFVCTLLEKARKKDALPASPSALVRTATNMNMATFTCWWWLTVT